MNACIASYRQAAHSSVAHPESRLTFRSKLIILPILLLLAAILLPNMIWVLKWPVPEIPRFGSPVQQVQPVPPSGVEEPASSSSAGLESGLIAQWTSGKGSGALSFDGKKSYVAVPNGEGLN